MVRGRHACRDETLWYMELNPAHVTEQNWALMSITLSGSSTFVVIVVAIMEQLWIDGDRIPCLSSLSKVSRKWTSSIYIQFTKFYFFKRDTSPHCDCMQYFAYFCKIEPSSCCYFYDKTSLDYLLNQPVMLFD